MIHVSHCIDCLRHVYSSHRWTIQQCLVPASLTTEGFTGILSRQSPPSNINPPLPRIKYNHFVVYCEKFGIFSIRGVGGFNAMGRGSWSENLEGDTSSDP